MYFISLYDYKEGLNNLIQHGTKLEMLNFMENYIIDYINFNQTYKHKKFDEIVKKPKYSLSKDEWNKNIRFYVTKSRNNSKYTLKKVVKSRGYLYNTQITEKIFSIYLIKIQQKHNKNINNEKYYLDFNKFDEKNNVIIELNEKFGHEVKVINNYSRNKLSEYYSSDNDTKYNSEDDSEYNSEDCYYEFAYK